MLRIYHSYEWIRFLCFLPVATSASKRCTDIVWKKNPRVVNLPNHATTFQMHGAGGWDHPAIAHVIASSPIVGNNTPMLVVAPLLHAILLKSARQWCRAICYCVNFTKFAFWIKCHFSVGVCFYSIVVLSCDPCVLVQKFSCPVATYGHDTGASFTCGRCYGQKTYKSNSFIWMINVDESVKRDLKD
jgi:hypothetical protein